MSSVIIKGDTSGQIALSAPAVAGTNTLTLPTITGTVSTLDSGTAVASTSETAIDFTGIPAGVRRITVMFNSVSTNGTANIICRIGTGGTVATTGYTGNITALTNAAAIAVSDITGSLTVSSTAAASNNLVATAVWTNLSGNTWVATSSGRTAGTVTSIANSTVTLSGTLDIVRITTGNGTDTFDAGSINILYE
jgi:hypothetical protein